MPLSIATTGPISDGVLLASVPFSLTVSAVIQCEQCHTWEWLGVLGNNSELLFE